MNTVIKFDLPKQKQRVTKTPSEITVARNLAKEKSEFYFSVFDPCTNGHNSKRYVSTGSCVECGANKAKTEETRLAGKEYYLKNKEKRLAHAKAWKKANPTSKLKSDLKIKYNLSIDVFYEMLASQNNACAICTAPFENPKHRHVDHCHTTGKVRGIVCNLCNLAIGFLGDSPKLALVAAEYLK